jgi:hypothetical protein
MKSLRFVCCATLLLGSSALVSFGKSQEPAPGGTYAIIAESKWTPPAPALLAAAVKEVDQAMQSHGFTRIADPDQATTIIAVRFARGAYEIDYNELIPHSRYAWGGIMTARVGTDFHSNNYQGDDPPQCRDQSPAKVN